MAKFILHICILICFSVFSTQFLSAQMLTENKEFTRADTLRGTISSARDWFDVTHYNLNLKVMPSKKSIQGYNDITFKVLKSYPKMQIDLFENMQIDSIVFKGNTLKYKREFNAVFVQLPKKDLKVGKIEKIRFYYSGQPTVAKNAPWDGGFVWEKDKNGKDWIGVACQGFGASCWYPNKDHQSDEPDSVLVSVAVPKGLVFVGNGNLRNKQIEDDFVRYEWATSYPINNYNVTLNIGDYAHIGDEYTNPDGEVLKLDYYVLNGNVEKAKKHFTHDVQPLMDCFGKYLGDYPFWDDGFALVETPYLGMEHQSAIAYGNGYKWGYAGNTSFTGGHEFDYIVVHEAGHEWWGNNITSADIADLWIHEGFCTYSEAIFVECQSGYDAAVKYINDKKPYIGNEGAMIGHYGVNEEGDGDMYNKGSLFLNTLRHLINNDDTWWGIIYGLNEDYRHSIVTAEDIIKYFNDKTGQNLDKVFDQYVRYPAIPKLEYKLKKKGSKHSILSYRWVTDVEGFDMPMRYKDNTDNWVQIQPTSEWQTVKVKKVKPSNFKFAADQFYVNFVEVE